MLDIEVARDPNRALENFGAVDEALRCELSLVGFEDGAQLGRDFRECRWLDAGEPEFTERSRHGACKPRPASDGFESTEAVGSLAVDSPSDDGRRSEPTDRRDFVIDD